VFRAECIHNIEFILDEEVEISGKLVIAEVKKEAGTAALLVLAARLWVVLSLVFWSSSGWCKQLLQHPYCDCYH